MKKTSDIEESIIESQSSFEESKDQFKSPLKSQSKVNPEETIKSSIVNNTSNNNYEKLTQSIKTDIESKKQLLSHTNMADTIYTSQINSNEMNKNDQNLNKKKSEVNDKIPEDFNDALFQQSRSLNIQTDKNYSKSDENQPRNEKRPKSPRSPLRSPHRKRPFSPQSTNIEEKLGALDFDQRQMIQDTQYKVLNSIQNEEVIDQQKKMVKYNINIDTDMNDQVISLKPLIEDQYSKKVKSTIEDIDKMFDDEQKNVSSEYLNKAAMNNYCIMSAKRINSENKVDQQQKLDKVIRECQALGNELKHKSKLAKMGQDVDI